METKIYENISPCNSILLYLTLECECLAGRDNTSQFIFESATPDTLKVFNKDLIEQIATESSHLCHTRAVSFLL